MKKCLRCANCIEGNCDIVLLAGCSEVKGEFFITAFELYEELGDCVSFVEKEAIDSKAKNGYIYK